MTWEETCVTLSRYYPISPLDIPKMTLYQVAYYINKIGWLEGESQESATTASSAKTIMGGQPGQVPSISDIRALAKQINPNIFLEW